MLHCCSTGSLPQAMERAEVQKENTSQKVKRISLLSCAFPLLLLPKALIYYCICGQEKLET